MSYYSYRKSASSVLNSATQLFDYGKKQEAFDQLHKQLGDGRYHNWTKDIEALMRKCAEVAVDLRVNCRDAFMLYRNNCTPDHFDSLGECLAHFRELAAARLRAAVAELKELTEKSPDDLVALDRMERRTLFPWIKYMWESFRTILDVTRNNKLLQDFYFENVRFGYQFCLDHKRNSEFRRLCEMVRTHRSYLSRVRPQRKPRKGRHNRELYQMDVNDPTVCRNYMQLQFVQLDFSTKLDMWQEAYRTIEDIHESMTNVDDASAGVAQSYYSKLTEIFWAAGNRLFHAYSVHRVYELAEDNMWLSVHADEDSKGLTSDMRAKLQTIADRVVVATLAVPLTHADSTDQTLNYSENNIRLATMLGFRHVSPTRQHLLSVIEDSGVLQAASPNVVALHSLLESQSISPLTLWKRVSQLLAQFDSQPLLAGYRQALTDLSANQVLAQCARVFTSMRLTRLAKLLPSMQKEALETMILRAGHSRLVPCRLDKVGGNVRFARPVLSSDSFRNQLSQLSHTMEPLVAQLNPKSPADVATERANVFRYIKQVMDADHQQVIARQQAIEIRYQQEEKQKEEAAKEAARRKAEREQERREEEIRRVAIEKEKRELARRDREIRLKERKAVEEAVAKLEETFAKREFIGEARGLFQELRDMMDNPETVTLAQLHNKRTAVETAQERELETVRASQRKQLDYLTRAYRLAEVPKLEQQSSQEVKKRERLVAEYITARRKTEEAKHAAMYESRQRLTPFLPQRDNFLEKVRANRHQRYLAARRAQNVRVQQFLERKKREEAERAEREKREAARREREAAEAAKRKAEAEKARQAKLEQYEKDLAAQKERMAKEEELERREAASRGGGGFGRPQGSQGPGGSGGPAPGWGTSGGGSGGSWGRSASGGGFDRDRDRGGFGRSGGGGFGDRDRDGGGGGGGFGGRDRDRGSGYGGDRGDRGGDRGSGYGGDRGDRGGEFDFGGDDDGPIKITRSNKPRDNSSRPPASNRPPRDERGRGGFGSGGFGSGGDRNRDRGGFGSGGNYSSGGFRRGPPRSSGGGGSVPPGSGSGGFNRAPSGGSRFPNKFSRNTGDRDSNNTNDNNNNNNNNNNNSKDDDGGGWTQVRRSRR